MVSEVWDGGRGVFGEGGNVIINRSPLPFGIDDSPPTALATVPNASALTPSQRAYEAYWLSQAPRRKKLSALGVTVVPCSQCGVASGFAQCGLCSCEMIVRVKGLA